MPLPYRNSNVVQFVLTCRNCIYDRNIFESEFNMCSPTTSYGLQNCIISVQGCKSLILATAEGFDQAQRLVHCVYTPGDVPHFPSNGL